MKNKKIWGFLWRPNKILKDPLNNIDISQVIKNPFKNNKTKEELDSIKEIAQKTMKKVMKLYKMNLIFMSTWFITFLISIIVLCPVAVLINQNAWIPIVILAFIPFFYAVPFRYRPVSSFFPVDNWKPLRNFLLDIKENLSDDPNNFPLLIQSLYFKDKEVMKTLPRLEKLKILPQDPNSPIYMKSAGNFKRPFIEYSNFIIKYVDYCQSRSN